MQVQGDSDRQLRWTILKINLYPADVSSTILQPFLAWSPVNEQLRKLLESILRRDVPHYSCYRWTKQGLSRVLMDKLNNPRGLTPLQRTCGISKGYELIAGWNFDQRSVSNYWTGQEVGN